MSGNSIGRLFTVTTFGESHGVALGCIVDGCPPGMSLTVADLQHQLDRRRPGQSRQVSQRKESDRVEILSGIFEGQTTGAPIGLLIRNEDAKPGDYDDLRGLFRPGHADYTYQQKYGIRDHRGGGRASARETAMRVAAGAIARKYLLEEVGISIKGWLSQMGARKIDRVDLAQVDKNDFFAPDPDCVPELESMIRSLRKQGDSIGARVNVMASGVPAGLGEPVFDRLDADIAQAMMSINAVKGVEIGAGFSSVEQRGSEHRDEMTPNGFKSNHAGGVLGGISSGQDILVQIALKPTSSILQPGDTIDVAGNASQVVSKGRHDPCVGIRAVPIAEAMLGIILLDHFLRNRGQNAGVRSGTPAI